MSNYEKNLALRQGHGIASEDGYFEARPQIDSMDRRKVFGAGFERGWEAALAAEPAQERIQALELEVRQQSKEIAGLRKGLNLAVRQNSHDMLMTGEELRQCEAALAAQQPAPSAAPECLTCNDHGAVGNILTAEPCPDCTTTPQADSQPAQVRPLLPESLTLAVDRWFAENTGSGGCSDKDVRELAALFYGVTYIGGRESVDDALAIVESFGPGIGGLNDTYARQILLAEEVKRLRAALAPADSVLEDAARWEFRWLNPANNLHVAPSDLGWKTVNSKGMRSEKEVLEDLQAYRYQGKPVYEVRPLFATRALEKPEIRCPVRLANGGDCPRHNLQCGWPDCNKESK